MLLDEVLPEFHVRASHGTRVIASPTRVYATLWTADFDHWGLMRALVMLRGLAGLLAVPRESWRRLRAQGRRRQVRLEDVLGSGFTLLREQPGDELVLGTIGRFWLARGELRPVGPESFREPSVPGTAKQMECSEEAWEISETEMHALISYIKAQAGTRTAQAQ